MKTILVLFFAALACCAQTNVLQLTWAVPPGYTSTLYSSTNLNGTWSVLTTNPPPVNVSPTNQVSFFTVIVAPPNPVPDSIDYAGPPTNNPPVLQHIVVDSNGQQWEFYGGNWN